MKLTGGLSPPGDTMGWLRKTGELSCHFDASVCVDYLSLLSSVIAQVIAASVRWSSAEYTLKLKEFLCPTFSNRRTKTSAGLKCSVEWRTDRRGPRFLYLLWAAVTVHVTGFFTHFIGGVIPTNCATGDPPFLWMLPLCCNLDFRFFFCLIFLTNSIILDRVLWQWRERIVEDLNAKLKL